MAQIGWSRFTGEDDNNHRHRRGFIAQMVNVVVGVAAVTGWLAPAPAMVSPTSEAFNLVATDGGLRPATRGTR